MKNEDKGSLYRMYDTVAEKFTPVHEFVNDRVAVYGCEALKLPPYTQSGDYECWKIAEREGHVIKTIDPVIVWKYEVKHEGPV